MPIVRALQELDGSIQSAEELLAHSPNSDGVHQAMHRLEIVDSLLASLVADDALPTDLAVRLGRVRDELGTHVLVAGDLDELALPRHPAASLLRRGVAAAQAEIQAIAHHPELSRVISRQEESQSAVPAPG
jgi:hypothetical protein